MYIEVDMSGKIEDYLDTVVAFRNKEQYAVLLDRKTETRILTEYRTKHKDIHYRLFAVLIYYCIKNYLNKTELIVIDKEYEGREADIKKHLLRFIWKGYPNFDKRLIRFENIRKKSNAHRLAYQTFSGKLAPNKILTEREVQELL